MNENIGVILLVFVILIVIFYSRSESFGGGGGGALIQLVAKGPEDSYLIGGPRPYSPWVYDYSYYPFFSYFPYGYDL